MQADRPLAARPSAPTIDWGEALMAVRPSRDHVSFLDALGHGIDALALPNARSPAAHRAKMAIATWIVLVDDYVDEPAWQDFGLAERLLTLMGPDRAGPVGSHPAEVLAGRICEELWTQASCLAGARRLSDHLVGDLRQIQLAYHHAIQLQRGGEWLGDTSIETLAHDMGMLSFVTLDGMSADLSDELLPVREVARPLQEAVRLHNDLYSRRREMKNGDRTSAWVQARWSRDSDAAATVEVEHAIGCRLEQVRLQVTAHSLTAAYFDGVSRTMDAQRRWYEATE